MLTAPMAGARRENTSVSAPLILDKVIHRIAAIVSLQALMHEPQIMGTISTFAFLRCDRHDRERRGEH